MKLGYRRGPKRMLDAVLATVVLIVLSPLMLVVALLVRVRLGKPVLFRQERPGLRGAPFTMFKFRTMTTRCDEAGKLLPDAERLTPLGHFLRSASLDELPELLNVVKGDMSLVGPRPLLPQYLARYSPEQMRRHEVRPGVTGWAQINGRNAIRWDDRLRLDVWYVDHVSFWLDLRILGNTVIAVVRRKGISSASHVTMPEFTGTDPRE
jgi:sugar transferase EpsL